MSPGGKKEKRVRTEPVSHNCLGQQNSEAEKSLPKPLELEHKWFVIFRDTVMTYTVRLEHGVCFKLFQLLLND